MKEEIWYRTSDNKIFNDKAKAEAYEAEYLAKQKAEEERERQKEIRMAEIRTAYADYFQQLADANEKYNEFIRLQAQFIQDYPEVNYNEFIEWVVSD